MTKSKKSKLFDHCNVETSVDTENNVVTVSVSFKEHMETEPVRVLYSASDVMAAVATAGIPAASVVAGTSNQLNNRIVEHRTAEYKFSLLAPTRSKKKPAPTTTEGPKKVAKSAPEKKSTPRRAKKAKAKAKA